MLSLGGTSNANIHTSGNSQTCGITLETEEMKCWGNVLRRADGEEEVDESGTLKGYEGVKFSSVSTHGIAHSCGIIKETKQIVCWGNNEFGECDAPEGSFEIVTTGSFFSCGLKTTGEVVCWGNNEGRDAGSATAPPANVLFKTLVTAPNVRVGYDRTCGITTDDLLRCWGGSKSDTNPWQYGAGQVLRLGLG